jgi:hypothetical protein
MHLAPIDSGAVAVGRRRAIAMDERRKARRLRALKGGTIAVNRAAVFDCRVRNLTPAGACLEVVSQAGIPDDFVLVVSYDDINKPCRVIWRADARIGVEFRAA